MALIGTAGQSVLNCGLVSGVHGLGLFEVAAGLISGVDQIRGNSLYHALLVVPHNVPIRTYVRSYTCTYYNIIYLQPFSSITCTVPQQSIDCGQPPLEIEFGEYDGAFSDNTTTLGSIKYFSCIDGYEVTSIDEDGMNTDIETEIICQEDGMWSTPGSCEGMYVCMWVQ